LLANHGLFYIRDITRQILQHKPPDFVRCSRYC